MAHVLTPPGQFNEEEKELMRRLCSDLTKDIKGLADKTWLKPALVSHVVDLTKLDYKKVNDFVEFWFPRV